MTEHVEYLSQCIADLTAELDRLSGENKQLRKALMQIAAYDDDLANARLKIIGTYSAFDEPGAVQTAREALQLATV